MPEEQTAVQDTGMEKLNSMIGGGEGGEAAAGKPPAAGLVEPGEPTPPAKAGTADGEAQGQEDEAAPEKAAPEEESQKAAGEPAPEEFYLPDGIENGAELARAYERLQAQNEIYKRQAEAGKERPAPEERAPAPPREIKPGEYEGMGKDRFLESAERDYFGTHTGLVNEIVRNTPQGRQLVADIVDLAKEEAKQEMLEQYIGPLYSKVEPGLRRGECDALLAEKGSSGKNLKYPRFGEYRPRVEAESIRSGKPPLQVFFEMIASEDGPPKPEDKAAQAEVAAARATTAAAKRASEANRPTGQRAPAAAPKRAPDMKALDEMIGNQGRVDPVTGGAALT